MADNESEKMSRAARQISSNGQQAHNAGNAASASNIASRSAYDAYATKMNEIEGSTNSYEDYYNKRTRTAWVLTTVRRRHNYQYAQLNHSGSKTPEDVSAYDSSHEWSDKNAPLIFNVNPNSYQMDNPFRQQVVEAKGGPVIHTFRDPNRGYTNFGFATMNIEMSSGSLMPWATFKGEQAVTGQKFKMPPSVGNFYRFLEIVQEDTVYDNEGTIMPNYQIIRMSTLLFPRLTLYGFFIQNSNWSEQAEQPTEVQNWQVQFKVYKSTPSLTINQIQNLYANWETDYNNQYVQLGSK